MDGNDMRTRIVDESIKLFLQKGYRGAAISDITDKVNITKAAFYWYFQSKNELLETIIDEFDSQFLDKIITTVANHDGDFVAKFKLSHKLTTEFAYEHKELVLAFVTLAAELTGTGSPIDEKITHVYKKFVNFYATLIDFGKQEGAIDATIDSNSMANIIVGNHHGVLLGWHVNSSGGDFDSKAVAKLYLKILLKGLLIKASG
jgi:AcrR family transcriptional regulator